MENAMKISIPLPVRVTVGRAWGSLMPYEEFIKSKNSPMKSPIKSGSNSSASIVLI
jgi:hypothetical protein